MDAFARKLRQFKETWIAYSEHAPQTVQALVGFLFNADDTPRNWPVDRPWLVPELEPTHVQLPRFREAVANVAADHARRRAA